MRALTLIVKSKTAREEEADRFIALVGPISVVSAAEGIASAGLRCFTRRLMTSIAAGALDPSSLLPKLVYCVVINSLNYLKNLKGKERKGGGAAAEVLRQLDVQRLDEYSCEWFFSLISNVSGVRKPAMQILLGVLMRIDYAV